MHRYLANLKWIETQTRTMAQLVEKWASINSSSDNLTGLADMLVTLQNDFSCLEGKMTTYNLPPRSIIGRQGNLVDMPLGQALSIKKRPQAPIQVFFGGHMDTVFNSTSPFQHVEYLDQETLRGPGVIDMKGGLAIMLKAIEALERAPYAANLGWEILITPDEEIGSPGSTHLFQEAALRHHIGLVFEPSFPDGALVSSRKGSANYTIVVRGKSAHAGRDFTNGRSSIYTIAHVIREIEELNLNEYGTTLNVGHIEGGGPVNIVPDLAFCRLNIRTITADQMIETKVMIERIIERCHDKEGIQVKLFEDYFRLPKPFDKKTQALFSHYQQCAEKLKIHFFTRESGGVSDGNILSAAGLPTIDSLGAIGGGMHTEEEYLLLPSLIERAKLTALFLIKLAAGDIPMEKGIKHD